MKSVVGDIDDISNFQWVILHFARQVESCCSNKLQTYADLCLPPPKVMLIKTLISLACSMAHRAQLRLYSYSLYLIFDLSKIFICDNQLSIQCGVTSTARHGENITCHGVTSTARHGARSHSFVYISTT